jgi:hypothetical protein
MLSAILGGIGTLISPLFKWLDAKSQRKLLEIEGRTRALTAAAEAQAEVAIAKAKAEAKVYEMKATHEIAWEMARVQDASKSWVDEYWTVVISFPLIIGFIPAQVVQDAVRQGFANMETAPDWYVAAVGASIAFAFGIRKVANIMSKPRAPASVVRTVSIDRDKLTSKE